jgi:hypothetical protein
MVRRPAAAVPPDLNDDRSTGANACLHFESAYIRAIRGYNKSALFNPD